jgi:hypothetical protein
LLNQDAFPMRSRARQLPGPQSPPPKATFLCGRGVCTRHSPANPDRVSSTRASRNPPERTIAHAQRDDARASSGRRRPGRPSQRKRRGRGCCSPTRYRRAGQPLPWARASVAGIAHDARSQPFLSRVSNAATSSVLYRGVKNCTRALT